jgi:uncharacterized protein
MRLDLSKIRTATEHYEKVFDAATFPVDPDTFRVVAPVSLTFDIVKDKDQFRLAGTTRTVLELTCSRCLEPFTWPVEAAFDLRYQPRAWAAGNGIVDREIEEDDLTTAFYENDEIELGELMREQFYLSVPMKPLCTVDCRGLCTECGTNLNRATCACAATWDDPRLAVLKKLKSEN